MSWIEEIEVSEADGKLAEMYAQLMKQRGKVSNILKVHSLNPAAMGDQDGLKHVDGSVTDTDTRPKMKPTVSTTQARICGMVASVRADYSDCVWQSRADQMLADHGAPG